ncbi:MAG: hypothetical protein ABR920_00080 [Terriglobales bacterium]
MSSTPHILHTLEKKGSPRNEVRHLLIDLANGSGAAILSQVTNAVETHVATGTQFEMGQRADALAQDWTANEGFKSSPQDQRVFDSLKNTAALAMAMGYTIVYDPRFKNGRQLLGEVPLNQWPGMTPKNGGGYEYAFDRGWIFAEPTLPPNHGRNLQYRTNEEFLAVMKIILELKASVGDSGKFPLGGEQH